MGRVRSEDVEAVVRGGHRDSPVRRRLRPGRAGNYRGARTTRWKHLGAGRMGKTTNPTVGRGHGERVTGLRTGGGGNKHREGGQAAPPSTHTGAARSDSTPTLTHYRVLKEMGAKQGRLRSGGLPGHPAGHQVAASLLDHQNSEV
jgi:hypothetical protein